MQNNIERQISALKNSIKFNRLVEEKFNNNDNEIEKAINKIKERIELVIAKDSNLDSIVYGGFVEKFSAFRRALGDKMWVAIANNPAIKDFFEEWLKEQNKKYTLILIEEFKSLLPENHGMSNEEILEAIQQISS